MLETRVGASGGDEPAIDEELLEEAQRHVGFTASRNEAINVALRGFVDEQRARRRAALRELQRMSDEGVFNYAALGDIDT